jgi:hypothetical protein
MVEEFLCQSSHPGSIHTPKRDVRMDHDVFLDLSSLHLISGRQLRSSVHFQTIESPALSSLVLSPAMKKLPIPWRLHPRRVTVQSSSEALPFLPIKHPAMTLAPPATNQLRKARSLSKFLPLGCHRRLSSRSLLYGSPMSPKSLKRICARSSFRTAGKNSRDHLDRSKTIPRQQKAFALKRRSSHANSTASWKEMFTCGSDPVRADYHRRFSSAPANGTFQGQRRYHFLEKKNHPHLSMFSLPAKLWMPQL